MAETPIFEFTVIEKNELARLRAAALQVQRWVPVTEKLPERAGVYVVMVRFEQAAITAPALAWYQPGSARRWVNVYDTTLDMTGVTHWQRLQVPEVRA